jgi:hypothetical protein
MTDRNGQERTGSVYFRPFEQQMSDRKMAENVSGIELGLTVVICPENNANSAQL